MNRLLALVLALFALVFLVWGGWMAAWSLMSLDWPTIPAQFDRVDFKAGNTFTGSSRTSDSWSLRYHYEVDGTSYIGERTSFGFSRFVDKEALEDLTQRQLDGDPYPIAYDPHDPERSVAFPGWNIGSLIIIFPGLICAGIAAVLWRETRA